MNGNLEDEELGTFLAESELYDLVTATHNGNTPLTYIRGNKTIDHMFGTTGILNAVENIGMVEFLKYFQSDHRGIYLDLYACNIFKGLLHPLQQRQARKVQLKLKKQTNTYLQ
eukprot:1470463-Ditylum_brightwellii.AAC.1